MGRIESRYIAAACDPATALHTVSFNIFFELLSPNEGFSCGQQLNVTTHAYFYCIEFFLERYLIALYFALSLRQICTHATDHMPGDVTTGIARCIMIRMYEAMVDAIFTFAVFRVSLKAR